MADRYWRGGSGTWNTTSTTNWSTSSGGSGGASVPTAADNVIFDQAGTYTVTLTGALTCLDFTVSAGTVTFTSTGTPTISGSMSLVSGTVWSGTGAITFDATTTGKTITTNGTTINGSITLNGVGGEWSLGSALSTGVTIFTVLTNGSLLLNGYDLTTGVFSSSNSNTRAIAFGSNNIVITNTTSNALVMATATGFTYTGTGGFTADASTARTFSFGTTGGSTTNAPNLTFTTGASVASITTGSWFKNLDFGTTSFDAGSRTLNIAGNLTLSSSGTYTSLSLNIQDTGTLTYNGKTTAAVTLLAGTTTIADTIACTTFTINGSAFNFTTGTINPSTSFVLTSGSFTYNGGTLGAVPTFTHTAGTATFNYSYSLAVTGTYTLTAGTLTLADGVTLSTGIFSSPNTNTRLIAFGSTSAGNIQLTHTTAATVVLNISSATGFTYTGPGGFTVDDMSVARTFTSNNSTNIDTAPTLTFTTGASLITLTNTSFFNKLDFGTTSSSVNTSTTPTVTVKSITFSSSGTYNFLTLFFRGSGTITANGNSTTANVGLVSGSSPTIVGTFTCTTFTINSASLNLTSGTLNPTVSFVLTSGSFTLNGGTLSATLPTFTHTAGTATFNYSCSLAITSVYTLTAGKLILADGITLEVGQFSSSNSNTRSIAFGTTSAGNINLTHTTAGTTVLSMAIATGFSNTGPGGFTVADMSNTRTFSFGSTSGGTATNAPNLTFTTGASVATLSDSWFNKLDFGTTSFAVTSSGGVATNMKSLTLSSTGTYTSFYIKMVGTGTVITNGKTTNSISLVSGTTTFADTVSSTLFSVAGAAFNFTSGTINVSSTFTVSSGSFIYNGGTLSVAGNFTQSGGTVTFNYSFALDSTTTFNLSSGALILADGVTLTVGALSFQLTTTAKSIAFGSTSAGNIKLTKLGGAQTALDMDDLTGFTYTGPGGFVVDTMIGNNNVFSCGSTAGGTATNAPNLTFTTGSGSANLSNSWFNKLDFGTTTISCGSTVNVNSVTLSTSGTYTSFDVIIQDTGTVALNGKTIGSIKLNSFPTFVDSAITCTTFTVNGITFNFTSGAGLLNTITATNFVLTSGSFILNGGTLSTLSAFTHTAGTATFNYSYSLTTTGTYTLTSGTLTLADGVTLSTGIFSSNNANTRSIQFGSASAGNINLTHTTAATVVLSMATITGFTYTGLGGFYVPTSGNTRTFTCGSTAGGTATNAPNLTFGSGASVATITSGSWFSNLDFGTTSFSVSTTTINVETITLSSSGTYTNVSLIMVDTGTLTGNGKTITALVLLNGSTTIVGTLLCSTVEVNGATFNFTSGTLTPSTSITITSGSFTYGGTATLGSVATFTQTAGTVTFNKTYSLTTTGTYAFTSGTLTLADGINISTGIFSGSNTNTRSIQFGSASAGNIVLTHTTALTVVLSMAILTGFTVSGPGGFVANTMSNTRTFTCGTTGGTTTNAPNLTFNGGASVATITTGGYFNKLDYGTTSFTQASSSLNINSLTLSSSGTYTSLTVNIRGTGTLTYNGKTSSSVTLFAGSPTIVGTVATSQFTITGTGIFNFTSGTINFSSNFSVNGGSFTYNGGTLVGAVNSSFNQSGGTVTFNYSYTMDQTSSCTHNAGALILADGVTFSIGLYNSNSSTSARSIAFGSASAGNISLISTTALTTVLDMPTLTGFTYTGPGGFTVATMTNTRIFSCGSTAGGTTTNAPRLTFTTGASVATITSGSYFNKLDFGTTSFAIAATTVNINSLTLSSTGTYTSLSLNIIGTGTLTYNTKVSAAVVLLAGTPTIADTIACTTFTINGPDFNFTSGAIAPTTSFVLTSGSFTYNGGILGNVPTFTHTAGTVTITKPCNIPNASYSLNGGTLSIGDNITLIVSAFISNNSTTRTIAFGTTSAGNIVLSSVNAATTVLSMATLTGFTYTGPGGFTVDAMNYTRTFTCGSTAGGTATNAPNLTFGTGASTATMTTGSWFNNLDFGTTSFTLGTTTLNTAGNLTLSSSGTYTALTASMVGTGTFNNNSKSITGLTINTTGTATLGSALTMSGALTLTQGTLYCPYNMTSASFASTGTLTRSIVGSNITYLINGSGATAFSNASATGITLSGFTINMDSASAKTFAGGGGSYPILNNGGAGALTISGSNTFDTISNSVQPTTFTFTIATTQTVRNFNVAGTSGNLVTINSTLAGSVATLSKASGIVSGSYLSIRDSTATGGATWYAGPTSTDVSNNTGWLFTVLSVITMGSLSITEGGVTISTAAV